MQVAHASNESCSKENLVVLYYEKTKVCTLTSAGLEYLPTDKFQDDVELRERDDIYDGFGYQIMNFGASDKYIITTSSGTLKLSSAGYISVTGEIYSSGTLKITHYQGKLFREYYATWGGYRVNELHSLTFGNPTFASGVYSLPVNNFIDEISWEVSSNLGKATITPTGTIKVTNLKSIKSLVIRITVRYGGYRTKIVDYSPDKPLVKVTPVPRDYKYVPSTVEYSFPTPNVKAAIASTTSTVTVGELRTLLMDPQKYIGRSITVKGRITKFDVHTVSRGFVANIWALSDAAKLKNASTQVFCIGSEEYKSRFSLGQEFEANLVILGTIDTQIDPVHAEVRPYLRIESIR